MAQPIWRELDRVRIPEPVGQGQEKRQWTLALELVTPDKLLKLEVIVDAKDPASGTWKPAGLDAPCTADGAFRSANAGAGMLTTAPVGALIARIGGSAADQPSIAQGTTSPSSTVVFSVGRKCIFTVPKTPTGSLFLGANVVSARMADVEGELLVSISEAL
jgi:hypothetical protein